MELLKEYQISIEMADSSEYDLNLQKDKFKGIIHKMPIKYLMEHEKEVFHIFPEERVRKDVVAIFIESFGNRNDYRAADTLTSKYISKVVKGRRG